VRSQSSAWQHASACQFDQFPDRLTVVPIRAIRAIRVRENNSQIRDIITIKEHTQGTQASLPATRLKDAPILTSFARAFHARCNHPEDG